MSVMNKAIKRAAKPFAQGIAEKLNAHKVYLDRLPDGPEKEDAIGTYASLHQSLQIGATECLGLKITHDQAEQGEMTVFSNNTSNKTPPPREG